MNDVWNTSLKTYLTIVIGPASAVFQVFVNCQMACCIALFYRLITAWAYARAVLGVVILSVHLSVRLSVCLSHACIMTKLNDALQIFLYHTKGQSLCYSDTKSGWSATPPSLWNLHSKWPTPFEKCRLRPISAHNVSTVGDSEKSSITTNTKLTTGFPTSHRWSVYVTPKCPKEWLKERFFRFLSISKRLIVSGAVNLVRRRVSRQQYWSHPPRDRRQMYVAARPSRRNYLITIWCGSVSSSGDTCGNPWESDCQSRRLAALSWNRRARAVSLP